MPPISSVTRRRRPLRLLASLLTLCIAATLSPLRAHAAEGIDFSTETLDNGLKVIYAPMPSSPVTQVRVLYHVGSRDERPDRQGFAHMFEHMMFRGSAHVKPEEHMKLIGLVGGYSNAFTSFDKTVYINTVPNNYTDMALWLEADRMSSFKVSPQIFHTERLVVAEEWRMRQNQPYGTMFDVLCNEVFKTHPYQWTPIGNMEDLQAAATSELQAFFNKYYLPPNAVLVVAGNTDVPAVKASVHKYFSWIPKGDPIVRNISQEPEQSAPRREEVKMRVPLSKIVIAYKGAPIVSDDREHLELLLSILGDGRSSRLSRALVTNADPLCIDAEEINEELQDGGIIGVDATLAQGKEVASVEKILREQITALTSAPVTPEELEKAKQQVRLALAQRWQTPETVCTELGEEMLYRGNLDRVNTARQRLEATTPDDLLRVAKLYFTDNQANTLIINPGQPTPTADFKASTQPTTEPVAQAAPRTVNFPADYPTKAPMTGTVPHATFEKGVEKIIDGVHVIVMEDHRLPLVNWSLTTRMGCFAEPIGKEGLASLTAAMVRRGPVGKTYNQFNEELDSRGITLSVADGGDITTTSPAIPSPEQLPFGLAETRDVLLHPAFDPAEFATLKSQALDDLPALVAQQSPPPSPARTSSPTPSTATPPSAAPPPSKASPPSPSMMSKNSTPPSTPPPMPSSCSPATSPSPTDKKPPETLLTGMQTGTTHAPQGRFIALPPPLHLEKRRIILIDRPEAKQSHHPHGHPRVRPSPATKKFGMRDPSPDRCSPPASTRAWGNMSAPKKATSTASRASSSRPVEGGASLHRADRHQVRNHRRHRRSHAQSLR